MGKINYNINNNNLIKVDDMSKTVDKIYNKTAKEYLAEWRERIHKAGLTQEQVCELTGTPQSAMSMYIRGKIIPRFDSFWEIESLLLRRGV